MEGIQNGILVLALAGCGRFLRLGPGAAGVMTWAVVAAAYGNVLGAGLGAFVGERGLAPTGPRATRWCSRPSCSACGAC